MSKKRTRLIVSLFSIIVFYICTSALTPNPLISRNKPIYGPPNSNVGILVNGKYGGEACNVNDGFWVAIKLDGNYPKILINWNNTSSQWSDSLSDSNSCKGAGSIPRDYDILKSSNSTDGIDGNWTTALTIRNNIVSARAHSIDFSGSQWVKMSIKKGSGTLDEIEIFDVSKGNDDTWFFPGTSITAVTYKSHPPAKNFADLITEKHPEFSPAIIRGGIGCIRSCYMADGISRYLAAAGNVNYWAIEMGTNDAWGGGNYFVPSFTKNMQLIIDSCKAHTIQPIIARMLATDSAKVKWQVHPDFLKAIDSLTKKNNLIPGPDLFTYFSTHPSELSGEGGDGVHPTTVGGASICRLWAEKMDSLYLSATSIDNKLIPSKNLHSNKIHLSTVNRNFIANVKCAGTLSVYTLKGILLERINLEAKASYKINNRGFLIISFSSPEGNEIIRASNPL